MRSSGLRPARCRRPARSCARADGESSPTPKESGKSTDMSNIVVLRMGSQPPHHHVLLHALAQRGDRRISLQSRHGKFLSLKGTPMVGASTTLRSKAVYIKPSQALAPLPRSGFVHGGAKPTPATFGSSAGLQVKAKFARTTELRTKKRTVSRFQPERFRSILITGIWPNFRNSFHPRDSDRSAGSRSDDLFARPL